MRYLKLFLLLFLITGLAVATPQTYRSPRGNLVTVELLRNPDRAMVFEPVYGTSTFLLKNSTDTVLWFYCEKIHMAMLIVRSNPTMVTFSTKEGTPETYVLLNSRWSTPAPGYSGSYSSGGYQEPPRRDTCYTCHGLLHCPVCGGSGHQINYTGGPNVPCSACGGNGRCYHCNNTGLQ